LLWQGIPASKVSQSLGAFFSTETKSLFNRKMFFFSTEKVFFFNRKSFFFSTEKVFFFNRKRLLLKRLSELVVQTGFCLVTEKKKLSRPEPTQLKYNLN